MKIVFLGFFNTITMFFLMYNVCAAGSGGAFVDRILITPYAIGETLSVHDIEETRSKANLNRTANISNNTTCDRFYIKYGYDYSGDAETFIKGLDVETKKISRINISDINSVEIVNMYEDFAELKIEIFPNISPSFLLEQKISYSWMVEKYTANEVIVVKLYKHSDYSLPLQIECMSSDGLSDLILFSEISEGTIITLNYDLKAKSPPIWWAIDSVASDYDYPYYTEEYVYIQSAE